MSSCKKLITDTKEIAEYLEIIEQEKLRTCNEQKQLAAMIRRIAEEENNRIDEEQLGRYLHYQKYFPFDLFPWEKFLFAIHNCCYRPDGFLRFPDELCIVGRGSGKNGKESFEDWCLLTEVNGVLGYDIDIFARSEDQAKTSFKEIYDILEDNPRLFSRFFHWNKEEITYLKTRSTLRYRTSSANTKDSGRQGKVTFDEVHTYLDYDLISTAEGGLGKKMFPRTTKISSDGEVRGGPLDDYKNKASEILDGSIPDGGTLPFWCRLDADEEVDDEENWVKAIPSIEYLPILKERVRMAYGEYKRDPIANARFMSTRMGRPKGDEERQIVPYEKLLATARPIPELYGMKAVIGIDFASSRDFAAVGWLARVEDTFIFNSKAFVLKKSKDLPRIHAPLSEWAGMNLLNFVDGEEIDCEEILDWLTQQAYEYGLDYKAGAVDYYRYGFLKRKLEAYGFNGERGGNLKLVRPSDYMICNALITSSLVNEKVIWGENPYLRWCANNTRIVRDKRGNEAYEKIEPRSRKTDGFMAFCNAMIVSDVLDGATVSDDYYELTPIGR